MGEKKRSKSKRPPERPGYKSIPLSPELAKASRNKFSNSPRSSADRPARVLTPPLRLRRPNRAHGVVVGMGLLP
jgi:hypothetical protein